MRKLLNTMSLLAIFLGFVMVGLTSFWLFWPYKTVVFLHPPRIEPNIVKAGQSATLVMEICKFTDVDPIIEKQFVDSLVYATQLIKPNNPVGCPLTLKIPQNIPIGLPPEKYIIRQTLHYQVNPLREIILTVDSEQFQIIK